jgi:hypothetical protein
MEQERRFNSLTLIMAGMEACWLYTALLLMVGKAGIGLSPAVILSIFPVSWGLDRLIRRRPWTWVARTGASVVGWLICILVFGRWLFSSDFNVFHVSWLPVFVSGLIHLPSFPNQEQLFVVSGSLVWWLGRRLAGLHPNFSVLISEFQFGIALLLILFFTASMWEMNLSGLVLVCLAFLVFSFLGISLAHAEGGKGWFRSANRSQWLSILLITICLAFGLGLCLSAVIKPELLKILLSIPKLLWHYFAEMVRIIIAFLISLLPKSHPVVLPPPGGVPVIPAEPPAWVKLLRIPDWVRRVGQIVVSGIWLVLILAALWSVSSQIIHWLRYKLDHDEGASYEPLHGAFREDLMHLFRIILNRLFRIFRVFRRKRERGGSVSARAESVRRIYRQLLDWAASTGCPRSAAQTPGEYLASLTAWFPEGQPEFSLITEQYVVARYSPFLPSHEALERTVRTWDQLKKLKKREG